MRCRTRAIASNENLTIRANSHSLRDGTIGQWNVDGLLDLHGVRTDHCNDAMTIIGSFDPRDSDVEVSGPRTPLTLLDAIGGLRGAVRPIEGYLFDDRIAGGRDQGGKRGTRCIVRNHDEVIARIIAHF